MNYKTLENDKDIYFKYKQQKTIKKKPIKVNTLNNPFKVLKDFSFNK